jgi:2'-5' RNA ligase
MLYAIEMFFDENSETNIQRIWRSLKESGISSYMNDSGSVPHITLSVFNKIDVNDVNNRLVSFSEKISKFTLSLSSIGAFPSEEGVLFLAPIVTEKLLHIHHLFHNSFTDLKEDQWPYYLPGSWVPHCTLSINTKREKVHEALDIVIKAYSPLRIEVNRVGLVEYHPVKVLKEYKFKVSNK